MVYPGSRWASRGGPVADLMSSEMVGATVCDRQFRAARAMLSWSLVDAAKKASLSVTQVIRCEKEGSRGSDENRQSSTDACLAAGIRFLDHGAEGKGLLFSLLS